MPNYDVLTDTASYHGTRIVSLISGVEIKSCKGCALEKYCIPFVFKPCQQQSTTDDFGNQIITDR